MKRNRLTIVLAVFALFFVAIDSYGQNPAQRKKKNKTHKKLGKSEGKMEVKKHTPSWYKNDPDQDGVPINRDKCPHTPKGVKVTPFGCPEDRDFDGIYDYEDDCPDVKGPRANIGCPWPDRDGDGILDKDDRCPDTPGEERYWGCPDTDHDGIADYEDRCPTRKGPRENHGCPMEIGDSDQDGLADNVDKCPLTPGPIENEGCPELKPEEKAALEEAFKNLLFETNKDVIMISSFNSLDKLANVMVNNPTTLLYLTGHTDSDGDDEANMTLSEKRAKAVKSYLVRKDVKGYRVYTEWHGEEKPVDTNDTPEGKANNRRVEMEIKYE